MIDIKTNMMKLINDYSRNNEIMTGIIAADTATRMTLKYTFFKNKMALRFIKSLSIYNLEARQSCEITIATINTVSGIAPLRNKTYDTGRFIICNPPTTNW